MASQLSEYEQSEALESSSVAPIQSSPFIDSKKRLRTAKIWDYTPVTWDTVLVNKAGRVVWRCKYCLKEYLESGGTKVIVSHLLAITIGSIQGSKTIVQQASISDAFQRGQEGGYKRCCLSTITTQTLDPATLENLFVRWIVTYGIRFQMVTREEFWSLLISFPTSFREDDTFLLMKHLNPASIEN